MATERTLSNIMSHSRAPIAKLIEKQRARLERLDGRIGRLMTERADEEDLLADMLRHQRAVTPDTCERQDE